LPSHRSARGSVKLESEAADEPTAVHARAEEHATDDSTLISAPTGSGVGSIVHVRPRCAALDPPASAAPTVTTAVNPSKRASARRLTASVRLQVATAAPFLEEIEILLSGGPGIRSLGEISQPRSGLKAVVWCLAITRRELPLGQVSVQPPTGQIETRRRRRAAAAQPELSTS